MPKLLTVLFMGILLGLTSCGKPAGRQSGSSKADPYSGVYEYVYPDNTADLTENHYIVLTNTDGILTGYYYGTTDEFDEAREGYLPGYFVADMVDLAISNQTIRFTLKVSASDCLSRPVDLKFRSTAEALKAGYRKWEMEIPASPRTYTGQFRDSNTIFFKGEEDFLDKTFVRIR